ncbi:hypothetical protein NPX13_g120 [Xylaria arbuscula]|uniref:Ketopantoate reductase C-terminal domain-containing protein n=1 Tax=Xylaria arbuscula TaxID=114810 RepID=A0A9W8NPM2_9PEZI|nr:hypothetical protein NPX13_g120 [Xylaria arbuscula]
MTAAAAIGSASSPSYEGSYLPPHIRRPATSLQAPSTTMSRSNYSQSETPSVGNPDTTETIETDVAIIEDVASNTIATEEVETENISDDGNHIESAEKTHSATTEVTQALAEQHVPDEPVQDFEKPDYKESDMAVKLSNKVHIIGFNTHAKFIAHALASKPDVPVKLLTRYRENKSQWGAEDRTLSLYDERGVWISSTSIPQPQTIHDPLRYDPEDPLDRPNFILGHSTHLVSRYHDTSYSMKQHRPGTLFLHKVPKFNAVEHPALAGSLMEYEGLHLSQHLTELLSSTETLSVVGLPQQRFLLRKLPRLIFQSLADTICVILGCRYNQIRANRNAMTMWNDLLEESITIASQLPELSSVPHLVERLTAPSFSRKMQTTLLAQHANSSPWVAQVRRGAGVPIDYFNGYLVRRAREMGMSAKYNTLAMSMVKARVSTRRMELKTDLLGTTQYMGDTDTIMGSSRRVVDIDDFDFEHETE